MTENKEIKNSFNKENDDMSNNSSKDDDFVKVEHTDEEIIEEKINESLEIIKLDDEEKEPPPSIVTNEKMLQDSFMNDSTTKEVVLNHSDISQEMIYSLAKSMIVNEEDTLSIHTNDSFPKEVIAVDDKDQNITAEYQVLQKKDTLEDTKTEETPLNSIQETTVDHNTEHQNNNLKTETTPSKIEHHPTFIKYLFLFLILLFINHYIHLLRSNQDVLMTIQQQNQLLKHEINLLRVQQQEQEWRVKRHEKVILNVKGFSSDDRVEHDTNTAQNSDDNKEDTWFTSSFWTNSDTYNFWTSDDKDESNDSTIFHIENCWVDLSLSYKIGPKLYNWFQTVTSFDTTKNTKYETPPVNDTQWIDVNISLGLNSCGEEFSENIYDTYNKTKDFFFDVLVWLTEDD